MSDQNRMSDEVQAYLDGELAFAALAPAAQEEALMWDRAAEALTHPPGTAAPDWLEDRIMDSIGADSGGNGAELPIPNRGWLRRPIDVRITPLTGLLVAAGLAAILLYPGRGSDPAPVPETVYVQFVLEAPGAQSVSVAGDFSAWEDEHTLDDPDGDGVWTGRVPLRPGVHQYMFVIDGADWVTDPQAERYADDGFGNRNAVIAVGPGHQVSS